MLEVVGIDSEGVIDNLFKMPFIKVLGTEIHVQHTKKLIKDGDLEVKSVN